MVIMLEGELDMYLSFNLNTWASDLISERDLLRQTGF